MAYIENIHIKQADGMYNIFYKYFPITFISGISVKPGPQLNWYIELYLSTLSNTK